MSMFVVVKMSRGGNSVLLAVTGLGEAATGDRQANDRRQTAARGYLGVAGDGWRANWVAAPREVKRI